MKRKIPRRYRYKAQFKKPEPELNNEDETEELKETESDRMLRWSWTALGKLCLEVVND
ncbi:hypothetical protein SAMN04488695_10242 [Proteiniclasticum ruminis]|uniref:Uncharacterized protein n=1 Tax=Proteiniclasticum ruminis TaxID=398199 RepID=A0A1I4ZL45_9CLOT|nr:hypothetical protein SAMN04488695_10242 [Proteiniclasticum ruminis]